MKYSIQEEELRAISDIINHVSESIENICNEYIEKVSNWGKKFNSELVYEICKNTIGLIQEEYIQSLNNFIPQYEETGSSFVSISKRYYVGEMALTKIQKFQDEMIEKIVTLHVYEIQYLCDGNTQYSLELIEEYQTLNQEFQNKIQTSYDDYFHMIKQICNENVVGYGMDILVKYQYETLQKISVFYDRIFYMFLEWYKKTLAENRGLLEEFSEQAMKKSREIGEIQIEKILIKIISNDTPLSSSSSQKIQSSNHLGEANQSEKKEVPETKTQEIARKELEKTIEASVQNLVSELNSPEKIRGFKQYVTECQNQFTEYKQETETSKKTSKFKKCCDAIVAGAKKYGKPMAKALSIIVPLIAPQGHIATKIATNLPQIIECFSGVKSEEKDKDKLEIGLECMKSIGVDKFPEDENKLERYIQENKEAIAQDILKKILLSAQYRAALGIDEEELYQEENKKLYEKITGQKLKNVPRRQKAYDYNFEQYDPQKLKNLVPIESEQVVEQISNDLDLKLSNYEKSNKVDTLYKGIQEVKYQIDKKNGYIQLDTKNGLNSLIADLQHITEGKTKNKILQNADGRYNKSDIKMLCDELESERQRADKEGRQCNIAKACQNFVRRQMGYPSKDNGIIVKEVTELIPVLNNKSKEFVMQNKELVLQMNKAQNFINRKNGNIKKKMLLNHLGCITVGLGYYVGVVTSITMATLWPLGIYAALLPGGMLLTDDGASSYSYFVTHLGEERTDFLLKNYQNTGDNLFQTIH